MNTYCFAIAAIFQLHRCSKWLIWQTPMSTTAIYSAACSWQTVRTMVAQKNGRNATCNAERKIGRLWLARRVELIKIGSFDGICHSTVYSARSLFRQCADIIVRRYRLMCGHGLCGRTIVAIEPPAAIWNRRQIAQFVAFGRSATCGGIAAFTAPTYALNKTIWQIAKIWFHWNVAKEDRERQQQQQQQQNSRPFRACLALSAYRRLHRNNKWGERFVSARAPS